MSKESSNKQISSEEEKIDELASMLLSAIEGERKESTISIFLSKIYKNNTSSKQKKINSIRLSHLNIILSKAVKKLPQDDHSLSLLYQIIYSLLLNIKNFNPDDEGYGIYSFLQWVAKIIQATVQQHSNVNQPMILLEYLLKNKEPKLMVEKEYTDNVTNSQYFTSLELKKEDTKNVQQLAWQGYSLLKAPEKQGIILNSLNVSLLFEKLFQKSDKKKLVMEYFFEVLKKSQIVDKFKCFQKTFLTKIRPNVSQIQAILRGTQSQMFDYENVNEIIRQIVTSLMQIQNSLSTLANVNLKGSKIQQHYLQCVIKESSKMPLNSLIETFIQPQDTNSYFLLYIIIKYSEKIPKSYVNLLFKEPRITNRKAIIVALTITQHPRQFSSLIESFFREQARYTIQTRTILLKVVHFSLQTLNKASLFSHILRHIPPSELNEQTTMQFLPLQQLEKNEVDKEQKRLLLELVKRQFDNVERTFKMKIDIYSLCGESLPMFNNIKQVNKIFQSPLDLIIKSLPNISQILIDAVLMGVNNKLQNHYIQENYIQVIQWAIKLYNKEINKFQNNLKQYLKSTNRQRFYQFILSLIFYNLETGSTYCFDRELQPIITSLNTTRVQGLAFSDFYIQISKQSKNLQNMIRSKSIILELRKLLEYLTAPDEKLLSRKEIKTILSPGSQSIFALQLIHFYISSDLNNEIPVALILQPAFTSIKPEYKFLQEINKKAQDLGIAYYCIIDHLPKLLKLLYPVAINFIASLLKSETVLPANKGKKKSKPKKSEKQIALTQQYEKTIDLIIGNIQCLFGDPNQLETYENLLVILEKILAEVEDEILGVSLTKWVSKIKVFHSDNYKDWCSKVINFITLWQKIGSLIKQYISNAQIERQFLILTDLLSTLYQRFRNEKNILQIQQKLLICLCSVYKLQNKQNQMQVENREIPKSELQNVLSQIVLSPPKQIHYFFCYTCQRSICQLCSSFVHRIHDKIYTGKEGNCIHEFNKKKIQYKPEPVAKIPSINQNIFSFGRPPLGRRGDPNEDEEMEQRFEQKWEFYNQLSRNQEMQVGREMRRKEQISIKEMLESRMAMRMERQQYLQQSQPGYPKQLEGKKFESIQLNPQDAQQFDIKSCSEKQYESKPFKSFENDSYIPAFNCQDSKRIIPKSQINLTPLNLLLLRELQNKVFHCSQFIKPQNQIIQGHLIPHLDIINNKIVFFRNNMFKSVNESAYGSGRNMIIPSQNNFYNNNSSIFVRNVLTSNKKLLVFSVHSIILILNLQQIKRRYIKKEIQKKYNQIEPESTYKVAQIEITGSNFDSTEAVFSQFNEESLAIVGQSQIAFYAINGDGKAQRHLPYDASSQPIIKFMWVCEAKNIFAFMTSRDVRMGILAESSSRAKQICQFKVGLNIKDFTITAYKKTFIVHILDVDGNFYRQQFNYKLNNHNLTGKQINIPCKTSIILSMIVLKNNKVLFSMKDANLIFADFSNNNQLSPNPLIISLKSSMESVYDNHPGLTCLSYFANLKLICQNQDEVTIAGILKKQSNFNNGSQFPSKKLLGTLAILQIKGHQTNLMIYNEQAEVDCYQISQMQQNNYLIICMQQDGFVWMSKYSASKASSIKNESLPVNITIDTLNKYNTEIKNNFYVNRALYIDNSRCLNFKDNKQMTDLFIIDNNSDNVIIRSEGGKIVPFISGMSFKVQTKQVLECQMKFSFLGVCYKFLIKKSREVQLPLTIKETMFLFTNGQQIYIEFEKPIDFIIKSIVVHGQEWEKDSVYRDCLINFVRISEIYLHYPNNSLEHYLLNHTRCDLNNIQIQDIAKTLEPKGYNIKQMNLALKIELLNQSLANSSGVINKIPQIIEEAKNTLIPLCNNKIYLQNSCKRLLQTLCGVYSENKKQGIQGQLSVRVGHPYECRTMMDLFLVENYYNQWKKDKSVYHYEQLLKCLSKLISRRVINLYITIQLIPTLVSQLSSFFKNIAPDSKNSKKEIIIGTEKKRTSNICSMLIAIICEYYQLLKNKNVQSAEKTIIHLLESIFSPMKKDINKEMFLHPFQYLEKLYLTDGRTFDIHSGVKVFQIQSVSDSTKTEAFNNQQQLACKLDILESQIMDQDSSEYDMSEEEKEAEGAKEMGNEDNSYKINKDIDVKIQQEDIQINKMVSTASNKQKLIINSLLSAVIKSSQTSSMVYHSFIYQLTISLFTNDYINSTNSVFYIGLLFNLLRIIEVRLNTERDSPYIQRLMRAIDQNTTNINNSALYMVLNCFISQEYRLSKIKQKREVLSQSVQGSYTPTKISIELTKFYLNKQNINPITYIKKLNVPPDCECISMSQIFTFQNFRHDNGIYILKYLGSLYLNLKRNSFQPLISPSSQIKSLILSTVVKNNLRVYRNIMYYEKWMDYLESAKIDVGFERINYEGIDIIYECAKNSKDTFIESIKNNSERIAVLQELMETNQKECEKIIEILNLFYSKE